MTTAHDFSFTTIDGKPLSLSQFKGHPVLVVNVASKCGLTPQYEGLVQLYHDKQGRRGSSCSACRPTSSWGRSRGRRKRSQTFCSTTFGVDFPLTAKMDVKGDTAHPFYKWMGGAGRAGGSDVEFPQAAVRQGWQGAAGVRSAHGAAAPEIAQAIDAAL